MKNLKIRKITKQIICIIIVLMFCNFIIPNKSYAVDNNGGSLFDPCIKFITFLCDSLMQFLQDSFTSNQNISNGDGTFNFQYSPAIIFSGTVQGLDINFIKPNTDIRNTNNFDAFMMANMDSYGDKATTCTESQTEYNSYLQLKEKVSKDSRYKVVNDFVETRYKRSIYYYEEDNKLNLIFLHELYTDPMYYRYYETTETITDDFLNQVNVTTTYTSIASELQPTIATWYNALRRIALVGLLSVLVYTGIRIVLSTAGSKENSKYKKMLLDWLTALCLLFTLHYIMSVIIFVTQKISGIFNIGDTDRLLNTLRGKIEAGASWGDVFSEVILYVVLTIYTVIFTFQYLKRVIYMAFFTLMAPLVTLTYPLDKMNDGKAQAFGMWIKEYIFTSLIQVVHLVVYYVLVGGALDLVDSQPIYAIVAIGFMMIGEKIIKSMFGFNNSETVGTIGAMAAGGLASKAINKLKNLPKSSKKGDKSSNSGSTGNNVRTAQNNPLSSLQGGMPGTSAGIGATTGGTAMGGNVPVAGAKPTRNIANGAKALVGRYWRPVLGGVAKGTLGVLAGGAGAALGFASGVAQGDLGKAVGGAFSGGAAGFNVGKAGVDLAANTVTGIGNLAQNVKDTFNEGTEEDNS